MLDAAMTRLVISFFVIFSAFLVHAEWKPSETFLDAVCEVESSGGRFVVGDRGHSLGHFQIQKDAWADVTAWRRSRNLPVYRYRVNVLNSKISRSYAASYFNLLRDRLRGIYQREPNASELYAAYNIGMTNFRRCHYNLFEVNNVTVRRCNLVVKLMQQPTLTEN